MNEAQALLVAGHYAGAYYLCGYSVECALKAVIARQTREHDFPDKARANDAWTHNLNKLIAVAGLQPELERQLQDAQFRVNWLTTKDWNEDARYEDRSEADARGYVNAVSDPTKGVLQWLKAHW